MIRAVCVSSAIALAALITAGPGLSAPNVPGPPGPAAPQPVSQLACFAGRW